jgi:hypothetical protein
LTGDALPFDQADLTNILHANGISQFIIFDTPAVKAIVGDLEALSP